MDQIKALSVFLIHCNRLYNFLKSKDKLLSKDREYLSKMSKLLWDMEEKYIWQLYPANVFYFLGLSISLHDEEVNQYEFRILENAIIDLNKIKDNLEMR